MRLSKFKIALTIATSIIFLFLIPQTVLASCNYIDCQSCVANGNCVWAYMVDVCMTKADAQLFEAWDFTTTCGGSSSQRDPTKVTPTPAVYTQQPTSTPRPVSTTRPTSTPVSKKASGKSCRSDADCKSGNCTNYICCKSGEICCTQNSSCLSDEYCSTSSGRYYCRNKLNDGVSCTEDYQCKSGLCDSSVKKCASASLESMLTSGKAVCGNKSCDYWLGETCTSCSRDCDGINDFCCSTGSQYANTWDWQNQIFNLFDPPGGSVPSGKLVVSKGIAKDTFFDSYRPKICKEGEIIPGECIRNDHCVKGVCVDNKCTVAISDETRQVTDEDEAQEIFDDQTEYEKEEIWINIYDKFDDQFITSKEVPGGLEIELEVQGSTAGSIPEATVDKEVETRLKVVNTTSFKMAVIAGITYPGQQAGSFELEEKKYTLSCSPVNGKNPLTTVIGSANAKLLGGNYYVLPAHHQLIVFSKVTPKQDGYLDILGNVYFSKEKMYADSSLLEMALAPADYEDTFEKTEVIDSILVNEKKCSIPFICR